MTAIAIQSCPNGCFEITYRGTINDDDTTDREFVNEMGPPPSTADGHCPNCGAPVDVDWADAETDVTEAPTDD